jgi:hypothetical protein
LIRNSRGRNEIEIERSTCQVFGKGGRERERRDEERPLERRGGRRAS